MQPFLKWAGGKRWFVANHLDIIPTNFDRYIEPFLGSGAVFFALNPPNSILGDVNKDLINVYRAIKQDWAGVKVELLKHQKKHSESYYYKVRDLESKGLVDAAAKFIYLNRTCFNGIYRVNREGKFNVPKGSRDSVVFDSDDFEKVSELLQNTELEVCDFETLIDRAGERDLIFADPPYTVRHNTNGFVKYNEKLFSWEDQVRLASALSRAKKRGAHIVATNANHSSLLSLYRPEGFKLKKMSRYSSISADPERRKQFEELLILH